MSDTARIIAKESGRDEMVRLLRSMPAFRADAELPHMLREKLERLRQAERS
ncbi:MAG: hypothetical protein AB7L41_13075 [Flavobacteriaceae bacterium]